MLLSAAAATSALPDVDGDEKKALLAAWDVEYHKLTAITEKLERDEHRRILSGQLSERQREHWIGIDPGDLCGRGNLWIAS